MQRSILINKSGFNLSKIKIIYVISLPGKLSRLSYQTHMNYSRNRSMTLLEYTTGGLIIGYKVIDEYT